MQTSKPTQRVLHALTRVTLNALAAAAVIGAAVSCSAFLTGCGSMPIPGEVGTEPAHAAPAAPATVQASCPPLGPLTTSQAADRQALLQRLQEVQQRYADCRDAALNPAPKRRTSSLFVD